jgi:MerR family mercuric resistance operon transcriptional regulator
METLTIGKVAHQAGVGVETVRFYEREGLIDEPPRRASGYRQYDDHVVRRIRFIRHAKELGFTLREIKELLDLRVAPDCRCRDVLKLASAKVDDIEERIRKLERMRQTLAKLVAACRRRRRTDSCPILEALED